MYLSGRHVAFLDLVTGAVQTLYRSSRPGHVSNWPTWSSSPTASGR